jgi:hypothetical protein
MAMKKAKRFALRALVKNTSLMAILVVAVSVASLLSLASAGTSYPLGTGNGAPPGAHFDLNIIGVKSGNYPCNEASGGNVIFVPLNTAGLVDTGKRSAVDIFLSAGPDFAVLADEALGQPGCQSASFQLPLIVINCGVTTTDSTTTTLTSGCTTSSTTVSGTTTIEVGGLLAYEVFARVEGTPGGSGNITTCGQSITTTSGTTTTTTTCSIGEWVGGKAHGKQLFINVTPQLTSVCFNPTTTVSGTVSTISSTVSCVPIFSPQFQNYFWSYDNQGNKLLQLRFYPCTDPQISSTPGCTQFGI